MPPKFTIDIGPDGFIGNDKRPRFKVKKNHRVEFNLVQGAAPVDVYFSAGSPFAKSTIAVGSAGSGELEFLEGSVGKTFEMKVAPPETDAAALTAMTGETGDIEVEPYP